MLDAFCPHLGANMGEGGKVDENRLECPFHVRAPKEEPSERVRESGV